MEPATIAAALWTAHDYEVDRYALICAQPLSTDNERQTQRARLELAAAAARAATAYSNAFGALARQGAV